MEREMDDDQAEAARRLVARLYGETPDEEYDRLRNEGTYLSELIADMRAQS